MRALGSEGVRSIAHDNRPGAPPVAIIGWDIWQNRFGGDTAIIGKTIRANGLVHEVVGVMPRKFLFPTLSQLWLPRTMDPTALPWGEGDHRNARERQHDARNLGLHR